MTCFFASISIWHHKYTQRHTTGTGVNRLTQPCKYILMLTVMCSQKLPVLHWMDNLLISKIYFTDLHNVLTCQKFKNYRLV